MICIIHESIWDLGWGKKHGSKEYWRKYGNEEFKFVLNSHYSTIYKKPNNLLTNYLLKNCFQDLKKIFSKDYFP